MQSPVRILRRPEVLNRTGWSNSTLKRKEAAGEFVPRVCTGANSVGWYEHEVDAYLRALPRYANHRSEAA